MARHAIRTERTFPKRRELRANAAAQHGNTKPLLVEDTSPGDHEAPPLQPASLAASLPVTEFSASLNTEPITLPPGTSAESREVPPSACSEPDFSRIYRGVYLPPIRSYDAEPRPTASPPAETARSTTEKAAVKRRPLKRALGVSSALVGAGALGLTMALPGVQIEGFGGDTASAAHAQLLNTGGTADLSTTFEVLNSVGVEIGDIGGSFFNYTDAEVQYPFASTVPLSDPFGERLWPVAGFHDAQDFAAAEGTPIQAIADGTVTEAGFAGDGCGFGLKMAHVIDGMTVTSRYCHMQDQSHSHAVGDVLSVGDQVGRVGNTGLSFGAHLHFALTVNGEATDPMPFLLKQNRATRAS